MERKHNSIVVASTRKELSVLQAFVAVVAAGSFTKAAKRARIDKSLLSRRVQTLEEHLGVRLLQRTTRRIHVTEAGWALYEAVLEPLESIAAALQRAAEPDELSGNLRIATIPAAARQVVIPAVITMRDLHPNVTIDVRANESFVDLVDEGIDVAFRMGRLADSSLVSRKLAMWRYVLCASPAWVERFGEGLTPDTLKDHWVLYSAVPQPDVWRLQSATDEVTLRVRPVLIVDDGATQLEAVRQGLGVSAFGPMYVEDDLESGALVRALPDWKVSSELGIFAVYPHRVLVLPRVSAFIELVTARVRDLEHRWRKYTELGAS